MATVFDSENCAQAMFLIKGKQMRLMKTQLPRAQRRVTEILLGEKGASYSNPAALVGEAVALEGGENGRTRVRIRKGHGLYSLCAWRLALRKKKTYYNREKDATSSRLRV